MRIARFAGLDAVLTGGRDGSGGGDGPAVVLLHGFGAPAFDLVGLGRALDVPAAVRFVFPAGPIGPRSLITGGRAWWPIDVASLERALAGGRPEGAVAAAAGGLAPARSRLAEALDAIERGLGLTGERLVLGGFSQGALLACDLALRDPRPLAGLALLSCVLLAPDEWRSLAPRRRGLRALLCHGRGDPILPFALAERLREALVEGGLRVTFTSFAGGHEIPETVVRGLGAFLRRALAPPRAAGRRRARG